MRRTVNCTSLKVLHVIVLAHSPFAYPTPLTGNLPAKTLAATLAIKYCHRCQHGTIIINFAAFDLVLHGEHTIYKMHTIRYYLSVSGKHSGLHEWRAPTFR